MDPVERGRRLQAEVLDQYLTQLPVHVQRVVPAPRPVQRQHQLGVQPLVQPVRGGQHLQLTDDAVVPAELEVHLADAAAHTVGAVGSGGACLQPDWDAAEAQSLGASPEQVAHFLETLQCVEEGESL